MLISSTILQEHAFLSVVFVYVLKPVRGLIGTIDVNSTSSQLVVVISRASGGGALDTDTAAKGLRGKWKVIKWGLHHWELRHYKRQWCGPVSADYICNILPLYFDTGTLKKDEEGVSLWERLALVHWWWCGASHKDHQITCNWNDDTTAALLCAFEASSVSDFLFEKLCLWTIALPRSPTNFSTALWQCRNQSFAHINGQSLTAQAKCEDINSIRSTRARQLRESWSKVSCIQSIFLCLQCAKRRVENHHITIVEVCPCRKLCAHYNLIHKSRSCSLQSRSNNTGALCCARISRLDSSTLVVAKTPHKHLVTLYTE